MNKYLAYLILIPLLSCTLSSTPPKNSRLVPAIISTDIATVSILLKQGADPNIKDATGRTPVAVAIDQLYNPHKYESPIIIMKSQINEAEKAKSLKRSMNQRKIVLLLLKAGGDPNAVVTKGKTPLLIAIDNFEPEIAKSLIVYGADPKSRAMGEMVCKP